MLKTFDLGFRVKYLDKDEQNFLVNVKELKYLN